MKTKKRTYNQKQSSNMPVCFPGGFSRLTALAVFFLVLSLGSGYSQSENNENHRFVPHKLPAGFVYAQTPEYYGTYQQPQKNGTIYDFINGGGEVYLKHGFRSVTHIILQNKAPEAKETQVTTTITLDIYDMGTPGNAKAAYADEAICPPGFKEKNIGTVAKTYHYEPDYLVYFLQGKYLIYLGLNNDALAEELLGYAAELLSSLRRPCRCFAGQTFSNGFQGLAKRISFCFNTDGFINSEAPS